MCSFTNTQMQKYVSHENEHIRIRTIKRSQFSQTHPPCLHFSSLVNQIVHHLSTPMEGCQVEGGVATLIHIGESRRILLDQDLYHTEHCGRVKKNVWSRVNYVAMSFMLIEGCTSSQWTNVLRRTLSSECNAL